MVKTGLIHDMIEAVVDINKGRRGFASIGMEAQGHLEFIKGHAKALRLFQDAAASNDPELMLTAEYFYTKAELDESQGKEPIAARSAETAIRKFDDALLALEAVRDPAFYRCADMTFPHDTKYRCDKALKYPKDAFHIAMLSDAARIRNGLSRMGLMEEDKILGQARRAMLTAARNAYAVLQEKALNTSNSYTGKGS